MRVTQVLNQCAYAGFVEAPNWAVTMRQGHHEPLISFETYQLIQERLRGINRGPNRTNLRPDFPLRGHVICDGCETPLTACWSKGEFKRYAYYLCPKRGCAHYGKSIRREKIEGEFEELLRNVQPTETLAKVAQSMFKELWDRRLAQAEARRKTLHAQFLKVDKEVGQFLHRIVETTVPSVVAAYEERISKLEVEKAAIRERMEEIGRPKSTFDNTLRTALEFLSTPLETMGFRASEGPQNRAETDVRRSFALFAERGI